MCILPKVELLHASTHASKKTDELVLVHVVKEYVKEEALLEEALLEIFESRHM